MSFNDRSLERYARMLGWSPPWPELRDYQHKLIDQTDEAFQEGASRVLVESMTGSGKTTVGASMVREKVAQGNRVLWLAHREELILQAHERIEQFGVTGGIIKAGHTEALDLRLQVGSVQSVVRRLDRIGDFDFIAIDEAHHALATSYTDILGHYTSAQAVGLTATPWRLDGRGLGEVFQHMVVGPTPDELILAGHILPARIIGSSRGIDFSAFSKGGEYSISAMEDAIALQDLDADAASVFLEWFPTRGTGVVFCRSVGHAEKVCAEFKAAGVPSAVLTGETESTNRKAILHNLKHENIRIVCSVDVISEGYDLPAISCVIMLRKTKSLSLFLQQAGRVLRPFPGKVFGLLIDLVGNSLEHGHPCSARQWSLESEDPAARADRKSEGGEDLTVRRCEECLGIHEVAPVCPYCGHEHEADARIPRLRAKELREIEKAELEALQEERRKERKAEERKCKSFQDWQVLGAARGYSPGWAHIQWRLRS